MDRCDPSAFDRGFLCLRRVLAALVEEPKHEARFWYELAEQLVEALRRTEDPHYRRILQVADKYAVDRMLRAEDQAMEKLRKEQSND